MPKLVNLYFESDFNYNVDVKMSALIIISRERGVIFVK